MNEALKKISGELEAEFRAWLDTAEVKEVVEATKAAGDTGEFEIVITTENLDRYQEVIKLEGWELEHYMKNPVDRLGLVTDALMTHIADAVAAGRGPGRAFYGWAVLTVRDASGNGRSVRASPDLPANPYHADIDLNIRAEVHRRDAQKQHADDLAARAQWKERPASD